MTPSTSSFDDERSTVLVVDDEVETVGLFTELLSDNYTVRTAYTGEEALEMMDSDVNVVLLDRMMPGMSGDEVLQTIRARNFDCLIVMVTAIKPDIGILDLPFDDYLVKPVTGKEIRDAVSRMIGRQRMNHTLQEIFAIVSKMATLEAKMSIRELKASSEYATLETRFDELREETDWDDLTDHMYAEFTTDKLQSLLN